MKTLHTIYTSFAKRLAVVLSLLVTIGVTSVWAETVTFTWKTNPSAYTSGSSNFSEGQVTFTGTSGTGSTSTRAWSDGLRMYAGSTAQFSVPDGYVITKIEGYTAFNFNNAIGQQTVLFTGLSKATCSADVTVTYKSSGYTITYNTNGGSTIDPATGTKLPNPLPIPTKTGYTFAGWYTNSNLTTAAVAGATINADTPLYAKWTPTQYTITYNGLEGATHSNPTKYTIESETITFTAPSERVGYNFTGWNPSSITKGSTGNKTTTAQWTEKSLTNYRTTCTEPSTFTVTYNGNGNTSGSVPEDNTEYAKDVQVTVLDNTGNLAKTGYTFSGWNTEANGTGTTYAAGATFIITENTTLYAKWTANNYTVTLDNQGATTAGAASVTATYNAPMPSIASNLPQKTGYTFNGYFDAASGGTQYYKADGTSAKNWDKTEAITLYAQWTKVYTVTFYSNVSVYETLTDLESGDAVTFPATDPTSCDTENYPHFIGWTADPIVGSTTIQPALVENVKVTGDCDYYAVFAKGEGGSSNYQKVTSALDDWSGEYLIVYETGNVAFNGGLSTLDAASNTISVTISDNTIEGNSTTDAANFTIAAVSGGYTIKSASGYYIGRTANSNGLNTSTSTSYTNTISYSNNIVSIKGSGQGASTILKYNSSNGQTRFRYYTSGQQTIALYKKGSGVNYTSYITTCCTSWTAPTLTYTTPLEENGTADPQFGAGTTHGAVTYASSNPSILSVNSTTGEISAQAPGTATVTATWSGDEPYCSVSSTSNVITVKGSFSVIFKANGGTGTTANQKADENNKIAQLNTNQFTRTGYAFVGWNTSSYGTGTAYTDQATDITLTGNLTLYAQWAAIVTLNDAGNVTTTYPAIAGGSITLEDGANACGSYEFVGWTVVATGDWNEGINEPALVATTYTPNAPTTLYAVYKIQSEGKANAFKLSFEGSNGNTYYVDEYSSSPLRGYSNITKDDAVTFIKTKMYPNDETRYYLYMEEKGEYLYYNSYFNTTSNTPSESQGWIIHTVGDKIKLQSTYSYDPKYLSFSDRDNYAINIDVNASGSEFNMLPAVTSTYVAAPLCNQKITITFETGNGDFVVNAPKTNPLTVNQDTTITLPTCEYPGYEFMGWLKDEQQPELSDSLATFYKGDYTVSGISSSITFYAYYKAVPEEVEFTGTDDVELLMYYYDGTKNYYYAVSHAAERGELSSKQNCFNATTWKFTNIGSMQYYIQDETGKYLGAVNDNDNDNDLSLSNTPKVWNFTLIDGLWKIVCEDSPSRALMYISTGKTFANAAISNEGNGAYSYVSLGICPYPTYTTNPVLSQGFSITNTAMVTSASGQKVKAASALTLETRNIELPCTFTISAPNITFYDNMGAEVTELTSSTASEQFELYCAYKPTAENTIEYPTVTITDDEMKTYTIKNRIYARSLPNTFAIVAKVGNLWYALPSQGLNSTTPPAAYPVEVDNQNDPTAVTAVPTNADWSLRGVYEASRSDATKDRYVANGDNLVFANNASPAMMLNASSSEKENYLLTDAQYNNYYSTNPGLYEWTPTTTDLETYQLTNEQRGRTLSVNIATVFGVHAQNKAVEQVRFLPITGRYTPAALQVVEWKENSVVIMYNGDPAQTASVSVNGGDVQTTELSGDGVQKDIAVYELAADGLATNPRQMLKLVIGSEQLLLPIPYIIGSATDDATILGSGSVAAKKEIAKVADLVVLKDAKLTADGAEGNPYKFRNVTIYGGGKLVIPSDKGFGVASLTLRAGGITDDGKKYDYVYPQFELRGTFTNSAAKINYDYITDYDHWYHLVLPFAGDLGTIKYPTEFYGANVAANNTGSWQIKRYAGEIRATGNYEAWVDIETEGAESITAGKGYIFWGAPKKVTVNGTTERQKWGIQRIVMTKGADKAKEAENADKTIAGLSSYANVPNNSGKDNDQGWNLIGNPYMVNLTDMATTGLHARKLEKVIDPATGKWNGKWEWNDDTDIRYLTIPSEHFDLYTAKTVGQAVPLVAGRAFFVQLEGAADGITFATANRASLMPALLAENNDKPVDIETGIILSNETLQDEVNFWIKDGKTNNYEYNADYPKTPNNNRFNIYGVHTNGDLSWVATSPEYAAESMPIGYQVPAAGTYTLSVSETYYSENLQALFVTDHEASPEVTTNLVDEDYTFYVNQAETNNTRFTVSIILKPDTENTPTGVDNINTKANQPIKFLYQDKIYILRNGMIYDTTGKQVITINK